MSQNTKTRGDDRRHDVANTVLPPELEAERALDTTQASALLGVAEITMSQWRARGEGPRFFRVGARTIRYRLGDLISYRDARSAGKATP